MAAGEGRRADREAKWNLASVDRVHLIAVAGVGMAALAGMLKERGFAVVGSDEQIYPPASLLLERLAVPVRLGFRAGNLDPRPDLVIVGNRVSRHNPEVEAVLAQGIPYLSFPEALARFFLVGHRSLVIAGTHGKTTSAAMLAWVLEQAGCDPSMMVGGESVNFGGNFKLGKGEFFIVEGDEYDSAFFDKGPKFLHYRPTAVLLTGIEFDHADIYPDLDAVKEAFCRLLALLPDGAPLVVDGDFPHAVDVASRVNRTGVVTFGSGDRVDWQLYDVRDTRQRTSFTVRCGTRDEGTVVLQTPGLINAHNALGVYVLAREIGLRHDEIVAGLAGFSGVARRQEKVGEFGGIVFIDDFAHHPTAVAGTLAAVRRRYAPRRLWAVFEPRSNTSRRSVFQHDYVTALANADRVIIGSVFHKDTDALCPAERLSPKKLVEDLRRQGTVARVEPSSRTITALVADQARSGDVIVMMSNGDFGGLRGLLVSALDDRAGSVNRPDEQF